MGAEVRAPSPARGEAAPSPSPAQHPLLSPRSCSGRGEFPQLPFSRCHNFVDGGGAGLAAHPLGARLQSLAAWPERDWWLAVKEETSPPPTAARGVVGERRRGTELLGRRRTPCGARPATLGSAVGLGSTHGHRLRANRPAARRSLSSGSLEVAPEFGVRLQSLGCFGRCRCDLPAGSSLAPQGIAGRIPVDSC